jgi:hypothetical protein
MKKNQIIIISVILFLIFCVIFYFGFLKERFKGEGFKTGEEKTEEVFSVSGKIISVDVEQKILMVKPIDNEAEVKVIISDETKLIKLEAPFPEDEIPPPGTQYVPKEKEITLSDFKVGDEILVKTLKNIAGKREFNDVEFIQVLP